MVESSSSSGGCMCGGVSFRARTPSKFCIHCHCRFCRRAHGAAFVTWVGFPEESFEVTAGGDLLRWYASSRHSERGFCSRCGTTMLFRSQASPGEVHVAAAALEGEPDQAPTAHVFADQKAPWHEIADDGLPRVATDSPLLTSYQGVGDE